MNYQHEKKFKIEALKHVQLVLKYPFHDKKVIYIKKRFQDDLKIINNNNVMRS